VVVAPATANLLAKAAHGIADDFLTTLLLAARGPVLMVAAMDGGMWEHPAVIANVATLRGRGVTVLEPDTGALASGLSGKGRFPEVDDIVEALRRVLTPVRDLAGDRVLVTAGPTREPIDPVRYISNRSSGKMGYGLAAAALRRGAAVTLISGPTALTPPSGAVFVPVQTAEDMREAVLHHLERTTIVVKAAAVADYRAKRAATTKIKGKHDLTLELTPNPDILAEVAARRSGAFVVGFAAETHDVAANARAKLESKGIDLLVANDVSQTGIGFDAEDNEVLLLDRWGGARALPRMPKTAVADAILSHVLALRAGVAARKTPA
jgi:phosphopantothenoylcysteine decarboxylase/phosphopantothenate--cysteine ligase